MANLTDADKVLRNDVGKSIVSKLDDIADAIVQHGGGAESLGQLSDVNIDTTTLAEGQSIVYNETTQKFENGQVSTVGGLNDLDDVTLTNVTNKQELVYDDVDDVFKNKTTRVELTQAEYDALANPLPDVDYYITDAPSMSGSSKELSYDGDTDSVYDVVEEVKGDVGDLSQLTTTVTSSLVGSVNEVNSIKANTQTATTDGTSTTVTFDFKEAFAGGGNGVLLISYRVAGTADDGIVLIKLYGTTNLVVSTKIGTNASKFTGVSYDSNTKKITATVGNYATVTFLQ